MARFIEKENIEQIGAVNVASFLLDILEWQDELSQTDWDDCVIYSTLDTVIDILVDNLDLEVD